MMVVDLILHDEYREILRGFSDEQRGRLIMSLMDYAAGEDFPALDPMTKLAFEFIKARYERDSGLYRERASQSRENGKKGGRPRKENPQVSENRQVIENPQVSENHIPNSIPIPKPIPIVSEKESTEKKPPVGGRARFVPPSIEEVEAYCRERGNSLSAKGFVSYYESNGWKVGKSPMKDWKAAIRSWEERDKKTVEKPKPAPTNKFHNFEERPEETSAAKVDLVTYINMAETAADAAGGTPEEIREAGERARQEWYANFMGIAAGGEP